MTIRGILAGAALLGLLAVGGCGGDGGTANPQVQSKDAPQLQPKSPGGGGKPAPATGNPPAGNGAKPSGPAPTPQ
jgi:hypothetical protein